MASTTGELLTKSVFRPLDSGSGSTDSDGSDSGGEGGGGGGETIVVNGKVLPKPSEGEAIPGAREGGPTTPDNSIRTVWTSPYERHLVFDRPEDKVRYDQLHADMEEIASGLPDRSGNHSLALALNRASRWFPPPLLWLLMGAVALVWRRPAKALALSTPTLAALVVVVMVALGAPAITHFSVPVLPAFALLMGGALFGPRP